MFIIFELNLFIYVYIKTTMRLSNKILFENSEGYALVTCIQIIVYFGNGTVDACEEAHAMAELTLLEESIGSWKNQHLTLKLETSYILKIWI